MDLGGLAVHNPLFWPNCNFSNVKLGSLMGGPQCRMSILRNGNVACPCHLFSPMSHVEFKKRLCHYNLESPSHVTKPNVTCRI